MLPTPHAAVESPPESGDPGAVCYHHPDRRASITCPHCGSYACGDCTVDTLWGDVMCEDCRLHGRAQYPLPWEHGLSPVSFLQTAYLLFAEARPCFSDLPAGRVWRALGFAACVTVLLIASSVLSEYLFTARHWASEAPSAAAMLLRALTQNLPSTVLFVVLVSTTFHAVASLLGGHTVFATSLRAACYLSVIRLLELAVTVLGVVLPASMPINLIVQLVGLFFLGWGLSLLAEHRFHLPRMRAIASGLAPAIALIAARAAMLLAFA